MHSSQLVHSSQFGFRNKHTTKEQVNRMTDIVEKTLEHWEVCSAIFLNVARALEREWHEDLIYKIKCLLTEQYYILFEAYVTERKCLIKYEDEYSNRKDTGAGVPPGSFLVPVLSLLFTNDISKTIIATFADDKMLPATGDSAVEATARMKTLISFQTKPIMEPHSSILILNKVLQLQGKDTNLMFFKSTGF